MLGNNDGITARFVHREGVQGKVLWPAFVEENFKKLVDEVKKEAEVDEDEETAMEDEDPVEDNYEDVTQDHPMVRSCTAPLFEILREDLTEELFQIFCKKINNAIANNSDLASDLFTVISCTILALFSEDFKPKGSKKSAEKNTLSDLIPEQFLDESNGDNDMLVNLTHITNNENWLYDFENLFSFQHIQYLVSENFGSSGANQQSKKDHPFWSKLQFKVSTKCSDLFGSNQDISSHMRSLMTTATETNFRNMWANRKMFLNAINNIITAILTLHLQPRKEEVRREWMLENEKKQGEQKSAKKQEEQSESSCSGLPRDKKRSLIGKEKKHLEKLHKTLKDVRKNNEDTEQLEEKIKKSEDMKKS